MKKQDLNIFSYLKNVNKNVLRNLKISKKLFAMKKCSRYDKKKIK